jgi:trehalose 6-phosphate synthase
MQRILLIVIGTLATISLVVLAFTAAQASAERSRLTQSLESETRLLAQGLEDAAVPLIESGAVSRLSELAERYAGREGLEGIAFYNSDGVFVAASENIANHLSAYVPSGPAHAATAGASGSFIRSEYGSRYVLAQSLRGGTAGVLVIVQDASYIDAITTRIWTGGVVRLLTQMLVITLIIVAIIYLLILRPLSGLVASVKGVRSGKSRGTKPFAALSSDLFFEPLTDELSKMTESLLAARSAASEEARMRLEQLDTPWTAERLKAFTKAYLKQRHIYVVTHREPYIHVRSKNGITFTTVASGAIAALQSIMEACGGTWVAYGHGEADRETADSEDKLKVPPDEPKYTLKRVWLEKNDADGHYRFSVEALYVLFHMTHTRPIFREEDWLDYRRVNGKFAEALLHEIRDVRRPIVLVQDYHFLLLPNMIKTARPDAQVALFMHSPWPNQELFGICPWNAELLSGMLGADVIGFNAQLHSNNFLDTVGTQVESLIDYERLAVTKEGHTAFVKTFPISTAFTGAEALPDAPPDRSALDQLGIRAKHIAVGAERLDFIKGIVERFRGVDALLSAHPQYRGTFTLVQVAAPNREGFSQYREYGEAVSTEASRVNKKWGTERWQPIVLEKKQYSHDELANLFRLADMCLVTSLHDSMNLVSKEFVAARGDEAGVLVLSKFAGASRDLRGALIVNPYSPEHIADAMHTALVMPKAEQRRRMRMMRASVKDFNVYRWAAELIKALVNLAA